jgi:hypothetical protein
MQSVYGEAVQRQRARSLRFKVGARQLSEEDPDRRTSILEDYRGGRKVGNQSHKNKP